MDIFSQANIKYVITLIVVLYLISHFAQPICDLVGLEYKGGE